MANMPKKTPEEVWRGILSGQNPIFRRQQRLFKIIPSSRRCKNCSAPFTGIGSLPMRLIGKWPYNKNPRFCNT
ncbi:MAG TPA: hypothetical protein VMR52_05520 [Dehalococcoidia bacterium]|nr:hypothetical protein [Dehalococcoidia bacterium]